MGPQPRRQGRACWISLQDGRGQRLHVFIDGGYLDGVPPTSWSRGVKSDLTTCDGDEARMALPNQTRRRHLPSLQDAAHDNGQRLGPRRKANSNHMQQAGGGGEGDHFSWKVQVNQHTGVRTVPKTH
jgi:hypothetical protein